MSNLLEFLDHISGQTENQHIFFIRQLKLLEQSFSNCGRQLFNLSFRWLTDSPPED